MYKRSKYGISILFLVIFLLVYDFYNNYQTTPDVWNTEWFRWRIAMLIIIIVGAVIYFWFKRIQNAKLKQQEFTSRIIKAQEDEWKQITAELHDSVGQNLTFINNQILQIANSMNGEGKKEELLNVSKNVVTSVDEIRRIMSKLYPHQLERIGFKKAVESLIGKARSSSGLEIDYEIEDVDEIISQSGQIILYRILQEAINNTIKHSEGKKVLVNLYSESSWIHLNIEDDGKGFVFHKTRPDDSDIGYGIEFMRERVKILNGKIKIESGQGMGTKINILIPK